MALVTRFKPLTLACFIFMITIGGTARAASISLSPSGTIDLSAHVRDTAMTNVTVSNTTADSIYVTLSYTGSGASLFTTSSYTFGLAAHDSQTVTVAFAPVMIGTDTATLVAVSSMGDTARDMLVGHALLGASFVLSPSGEIAFNTRPGIPDTEMLTIRNLTTLALPLTLSLSGSSDFTVNGLSVTVGANTMLKVPIVFMSNTAGTVTGKLSVRSLTGDTGSVSLIGHAILSAALQIVVPDEVDFSAKAGESECLPIAIENNTSGAVSISGLELNTNVSNAFSYSGSTSFQIAANSSDTIDVCYMAPMPEPGEQHATLNFHYASLTDSSIKGNENIQLMGMVEGHMDEGDSLFFLATRELEFDNVLVDSTMCQAVRISNPTVSAVTIDSAFITGPDGSEFSVEGATMVTLPADSVAFVDVCFTPTAAMEETNSTLTLVVTSALGTSDITVELEANAIDSITNNGELTNCIFVRHEHGVLGPLVMGGSDTSAIFLTNRTKGSVTINSATIGGTNASAFSILSTFPMTIQAGAQGQLMVAFNPPSSGGPSFGATISLNATGSQMTCGAVSIHVEGVSVPGMLDKDRDTSDIDLGKGLTGNGSNVIGIINRSGNKCLPDTITITNTTQANITVENIVIPPNPNFTLISISQQPPFTLAAGQSVTAVVEFCDDPTTQTFTGTMFVATSQSIEPQAYQLQAIQAAAPNAVEENNPVAINFAVLPNPSAGEVFFNLPGAATANVEVYDVLGNLIARVQGTSKLEWNGMNASGSPVATGQYIVRVTGTDAQGQPYRASRELVIQH